MNERKRLLLVSLASLSLFSLLIIQFFSIQVIQHEKWSKIARSQHEIVLAEPFKRGTFYFNTDLKKGHPQQEQAIVIDVPKFHMHADPLSIPLKDRVLLAEKLAFSLKSDASSYLIELKRKSRNRRLHSWLNRSQKEEIHKWWTSFARKRRIPLNALFFINDYQRSYPCGKLLGQVLHTIRDDKDVHTKQAIPTGGLELQLNDYLKGTLGKRKLLRSPRHSLETANMIQEPENGADVYLTINHYLQALAEEEIEKGVKQAGAKNGWVVVMQPHSGEILAMAQYPFFYPADYQDYYNNPLLTEHTRCKAVSDGYEPASTIKPLTLAICLKANEELQLEGKSPLFSDEEKVDTRNGHFPGRTKPLEDGHKHSFLNMYMALQKSSNVYMGKIIDRLMKTKGAQWYHDQLEEIFSFGKKTEIEIPAEHQGLLPEIGKKNRNGSLQWSLATPYSLAIGHNLRVNSLQMLRAYAVLANGGYDVKPHLIKKIVRGHKSEKIYEIQNEEERKRLLSPEIVDKVIKSMKFVCKSRGTASRANVSGYTEAGKTGTAKKIVNGDYSNQHYFSSFVGFSPSKNAQILILVAINEPRVAFIPNIGKNHHAGQCAAPIFREVATRSLQYLGTEPDDPHGYPKGDPRRDYQKADLLKEVDQLDQLYKNWNESNNQG